MECFRAPGRADVLQSDRKQKPGQKQGHRAARESTREPLWHLKKLTATSMKLATGVCVGECVSGNDLTGDRK